MEAEFWHKRWADGEIGFHEGQANDMLVAHFKDLHTAQNARIFVPLCGKTRDIHWLLSQGRRVAGAELNETAVTELFAELGVTPDITPCGGLTKYSAENIDIFQGNLFDLTADDLGPVDAVYDRAAMVALPADMRKKYAAHLVDITNAAPMLLLAFDYDQNFIDGPPFSVPADEITAHYSGTYTTITNLHTKPIEDGQKGPDASEKVWLLGQ